MTIRKPNGKEFDEVVIYEGLYAPNVQQPDQDNVVAQARLSLRGGGESSQEARNNYHFTAEEVRTPIIRSILLKSVRQSVSPTVAGCRRTAVAHCLYANDSNS